MGEAARGGGGRGGELTAQRPRREADRGREQGREGDCREEAGQTKPCERPRAEAEKRDQHVGDRPASGISGQSRGNAYEDEEAASRAIPRAPSAVAGGA